MGMVFNATHRDLERAVAIKLLSPHLIDDDKHRARFVREARAMAKVNSPHVIRVHDAGEENEWPFIAMELLDGGDLSQAQAEHGTFELPVALRLFSEIATGIRAAHDAGLVHRDIKPSNVLLRNEASGPTAVVCDFGISRILESSSTVTSGVLGTPSYMAPERFHGADASKSSDVYALGCLLYELVTGRPPYTGSVAQVTVAHLQQPIPRFPDRTPAAPLNGLLDRSLKKEPASRYDTVDVLLEELRLVEGLHSAETVRVAPPVVERVEPWWRRFTPHGSPRQPHPGGTPSPGPGPVVKRTRVLTEPVPPPEPADLDDDLGLFPRRSAGAVLRGPMSGAQLSQLLEETVPFLASECTIIPQKVQRASMKGRITVRAWALPLNPSQLGSAEYLVVTATGEAYLGGSRPNALRRDRLFRGRPGAFPLEADLICEGLTGLTGDISSHTIESARQAVLRASRAHDS